MCTQKCTENRYHFPVHFLGKEAAGERQRCEETAKSNQIGMVLYAKRVTGPRGGTRRPINHIPLILRYDHMTH